ncbi:MAG: pyrimidine-nucleoside phosphorylase, partial [Halanaerobium sp.]
TAAGVFEVKAEQSGYISEIKALDVGLAAMILGAGRENKESQIDLAVGLELNKKTGDQVSQGDTLAVLHYNDSSNLEEAKQKLLKAFTITEAEKAKNKLIYEIIK